MIELNLGSNPGEELRRLTANSFKNLLLNKGDAYGAVLWEGKHYGIITKICQGDSLKWTASVGISKKDKGFKEYVSYVELGELAEDGESYVFSKDFIEAGLKYVVKRAQEKEEAAENEFRV